MSASEVSTAADRLVAAKQLAKEAYRVAQSRRSTAIPARLQRAAQHTTALARVAVVGERKRGKSTLVNALVGRPELLPRDVDVATNTYIEVLSPVRLGLPAVPAARVHLMSGATVDADIADLGRWASEQHNPHNARRVAYVQVLLPHPLLDAGLVLLDTPGLGGLLSAHGTMTLSALDQSNALLLMLGGAAPASADELSFLDHARGRVTDTIVVESAGPEATDVELVAGADREALRRHDPALAKVPVMVVSPLDAHDALLESDPDVARELRSLSGLDELASHLLHGILEPELERQTEVLATEVMSCLDELAGPDRALVATLGGMSTETALERARGELASAERASPVSAFDTRFGELRREVDATMQAQISRDRDELTDQVEDRWNSSVAGALPDLCRSILARAATDASARLADGAGPLAAQAAEQHGLGAVQTTLDPAEAEFSIDMPGRPRAARQLDQERMLGWMTRGGPMLAIGVATTNPVLVGIGLAMVAASEYIQGSTVERRRAREYVQRSVQRGQLELRTMLDERASAVRSAFVDDLHARHSARIERLRATVHLLQSGADVEAARARVAQIDALQARLAELTGARP